MLSDLMPNKIMLSTRSLRHLGNEVHDTLVVSCLVFQTTVEKKFNSLVNLT